jgi:hypothetical protein
MKTEPGLQSALLDERRESWRADLELPLRWCRLPGFVDADTLANALGLEAWHRREGILADIDAPLREAIDQVSDPQAASALRLLEVAVRRLTEPAQGASVGEPTPLNLSVDGLSFMLPGDELHLQPRDWLGIALTLPDGYPVITCVEVVWVGSTKERLHVGGRFHHVTEPAARKLNRYMLLTSTH